MTKFDLRIAFLFLAVPAMFASNMVIARGFGGSIPPITLAMLRWLIAGAVLVPMALGELRDGNRLRGQWGVLAALTLLGGVLSVAPQYAAATLTQAGHIALIFAAAPILVCFIERLFCGRSLHAVTLIGALICFAGIAVVVSEGDLARLREMEFNRGDLLALIAATAWAGYTALTKHRPTGLSATAQMAVLAMGGGLALVPFAGIEWALKTTPVQFGWHAVMGVLALALIAGVGAYCAYSRLLDLMGAARAAMSLYLIPFWALILSALFLDETIRPYHIFAMGLVLSGLAVSNATGLFARTRGAVPETTA